MFFIFDRNYLHGVVSNVFQKNIILLIVKCIGCLTFLFNIKRCYLSKTISTDLLMYWLSLLFKSILRVKILKSFIGLFVVGRDSKMF